MTPPLIVVSGLPRSGTSLMMQMLRAGGIEVVTDGFRPADEDNPWGYLEDDRVRRLAEDASWLREVRGRAVKIVSPLLRHIPADLPGQVLFMRRDLDAILASQARMLRRRGIDPGDDAVLRRAFEDHRLEVAAFLAASPNLDAIEVRHEALLADPAPEIVRVAAFLDRPLDVVAMAGCVRTRPHDQRPPLP